MERAIYKTYFPYNYPLQHNRQLFNIKDSEFCSHDVIIHVFPSILETNGDYSFNINRFTVVIERRCFL
jgi:uncharacterized protein YozE (UPF0346 family)